MRSRFFPLKTYEAYMKRIELIAIEFGIVLPETTPLIQVMHLASAAQARRDAKEKAIRDGKQFNG